MGVKRLRFETTIRARADVVLESMLGADGYQHVTADFEEYMKEVWPRALEALRQLCEARDPS